VVFICAAGEMPPASKKIMSGQLLECQCQECGAMLTFRQVDFVETRQDEYYRYGQTVPCSHCKKHTTYYMEKSQPRRWTGERAPSGLACPYCKSTALSGPQEKLTSTGVALIIVGLIFTVAIFGLILILIGLRQKETKYLCHNCKKWF
jgi:uncharacterized protein YbaR (Trm112 family)